MQPDKILIETTKTHRNRLASALSHGPLGRRRPVNTNLKRLMGSIVLAAVAGVACIGFGFVSNLLLQQKEDAALASFQSAMAANPLPDTEEWVTNEDTGFQENAATGEVRDPTTGFLIDENGYAVDPEGNLIDPRLDWLIDPATGYYTDPVSGITIDPVTRTVIREDDGS